MSPSKERSTILVDFIAATLVWYNFHVFGSLATIISPAFFVRSAPTLLALAYFAPFVIGLVAKPLGALLFGRVGDLKSRKRALSQSLFLSGITTLLLALLPGYGMIGVTAPIMLLALRFLQGLAFGGVYAGALLFCAERAPASKRGFATGWIQMTATLGLLLSIGSISVIHRFWNPQTFPSYGWRVTFLPSLILIVLSIYMRRIEDTTAAQSSQKTGSIIKGLSAAANLKLIVVTLLLVAGQTAVWYMSQFYLMFHLQNVLKVNPRTATIVVVTALLISLPFFVVFGALSDKVGRKKLIAWSFLLATVLSIPAYAVMQRAANTHVVRISPTRNFVTGAPGPTSLTVVDSVLKPAVESATPNVFLLITSALLLTVIFAMVSGPLGAYLAECFPFEVRFTSTAFSFNLAHGVTSTLLPFYSLPLLVTNGNIYAGLYYAVAVTLVAFLTGTFIVRETTRSGSIT